MSVEGRDSRHPLEVLLAESGVTDSTDLLTETRVPVEEVEKVTPSTLRHPRTEVLRTLDIHKQTLLNYHKEYGHLLQAKPAGPRGGWMYSDLDVEFITGIKNAKNERMREGIAATQAERIAQLTAGVNGGRRAAEQLRRELRALVGSGSLPGVPKRIAALLERVPSLRKARPMQQLVVYYATYHVTTDLVQLDGTEAPPVTTVERAFRRCR